MKRWLLLFAALVLTVFAGIVPAQAHHNDADLIPTARKMNDLSTVATYTVVFDSTTNGWSNNTKTTVMKAFDKWDVHLSSVTFDQYTGTSPDLGNKSVFLSCGDLSSGYDSTIVIHQYNGYTGAELAVTSPCWTTQFAKAVINVSDGSNGVSFNYDWSRNPSSTEYDLWATLTHEVGHVVGFGGCSDLGYCDTQGHWLDSIGTLGICPPDWSARANMQTMCRWIWQGSNVSRSLETHDLGELDDNYSHYVP